MFVRRIRLPLYDLSERRCYQRDFERFDSLGRRSDLCRAYSRVFPTNFQRATFRSVGLDPRRLLVAPPASISPRSPSRDVRSTSYVLPPPRPPREYLLTLEPSETISPVVGFIYFSFSREKRDESFSSRSTDRALFLLSTRKDECKNELAERRRWRLDRVTPWPKTPIDRTKPPPRGFYIFFLLFTVHFIIHFFLFRTPTNVPTF